MSKVDGGVFWVVLVLLGIAGLLQAAAWICRGGWRVVCVALLCVIGLPIALVGAILRRIGASIMGWDNYERVRGFFCDTNEEFQRAIEG